MPEISCILCTARDDYPIIGLPHVHLLEPTLKSLARQTFKDFELIIVDALYDHRKCYDFTRLPFPVKHVPPHTNHRFWLDRRRWGVCGQLNTGLLYAEGELVVRIDDCSEFEDGYLQKFWEGYQSGYFPMAMHIRYLEGKPARVNQDYLKKGYEAKYSQTLEEEGRAKLLKRLYGENGVVKDTRWPTVEAHGGRMIAPVNWMYGYSSFSLEAALKVNGYDENFDGDKSLEDVDFGSRLEMAGYRGMFLLDTSLWVIEHEHKLIPEDVVTRNVKNIKCNYALYLLNRRKGRWRANADKLTEADIEFLIEESLRPPCSPRPHFYEDDFRGELFKLWADNQPIFDLREERLTV